MLQNLVGNLVLLVIDKRRLPSPPIDINLTSLSNVTVRKGKGRPRLKNKSIEGSGFGTDLNSGVFRDVPVTLALHRVLRALKPSSGCS